MQPKREYPSSTIAFSSSRVMPLKASRGVWSMGVEEVGVDGSNNPIEYTGETSRPSAAHDGNAAATQTTASAARIILVTMLVSFLSVVENWVCETLVVVRLLSYANRQQAYDNKVCAASFPMPFHASTMASFAICLSKPLVSQLKIGDMLAHPSCSVVPGPFGGLFFTARYQ